MRRRGLSLSLVGALFVAAPLRAQPPDDFVRVEGNRFMLRGEPYRFLGVNFWFGMQLGAEQEVGDRARLVRELDHLQRLGVRNLRVMAASEGPNTEPFRVVPAVQPEPGV